jgi:fructose-bisphosphate aldolase class II
MRTRARDILIEAYGSYGVAAFNVFTAEQVHGVFAGASAAKAPVIVQITPAARRYMGPAMLQRMIEAAEELYPDARVSVHLDHGDTAHCADAIASGAYDSVMIDASHEPFERNVALTKEVVARAHDRGMAVEAELGVLSGVEDDMAASAEQARCTDPGQAVEFVAKTGCDSLAVAVGTSHGAYKFRGAMSLNLEILAQIQKALPKFPLVLHGASAVPADEIKRINHAGGGLRTDSRGIALDELRDAVRLGVAKVNIATDMRLLWTRICREFFRDAPDQFDPVVPGKKYMEALQQLVVFKCHELRADVNG